MQSFSVNQYLVNHIRTVPDWPAPGVQFRDITPCCRTQGVPRADRCLCAPLHGQALRPDVVAGLDARVSSWALWAAHELNVGFVPIRKGQAAFTTVEETYELEYGSVNGGLGTHRCRETRRPRAAD